MQPAHLAAPLVVESVLFVRVCDGCLTSLVVLVGVEVALRPLLVLRLILGLRFEARGLISVCWLWVGKHRLLDIALRRLLGDVLLARFVGRLPCV